MSKRSKFSDFMYDFFGGLVIILIILCTFFCCSSNVRTFTYKVVDNMCKKDTTPTVTHPKDTVVIIRKNKPQVVVATPQVNVHVDTIPLKKGNDNLCYIKTKVNGIPMTFALDTGCSDMSISIIEYLFLEHQGLVRGNTNQDSESILANGDTEQCFTTTIDNITIGNKVIKNVQCSVSPNQNAALLLGQSVLSKLGEVTIKYNKQIMLIE